MGIFSNPTPSVRSRKTKTEVSDIEEPPVTKPTSRVNTAVLQYMDSIRSRQKPLDPQGDQFKRVPLFSFFLRCTVRFAVDKFHELVSPSEISLFDEPGSAVWDDHLLLNCTLQLPTFRIVLHKNALNLDENSSPAGSSVQMDLSESSFSDIGLSSDEQGISSEYNWQSDFSSYDLGGLYNSIHSF